MRSWYEKGYLRADAATLSDVTPDVKAGKYAIEYEQIDLGTEDFEAAGLEYQGRMYPYSGIVSYDHKFIEPILTNEKASATMTSISVTSRHPERAMMFIELMNTDRYAYNLLCNGIDSIYYYNRKLGRVASSRTGEFSPIGEFYDTELASYMDFAGGKNAVRARARVIRTNGVPEQSYEVFSYVFPFYSNAISASEGAIVVNLRASFLSDMILSVSERGNYTEGAVLVCDEKGRVVCGQAEEGFLADVTGEEFYRIADASRELSGSAMVTRDGERFAMTFTRPDADGWIFIGLSPYAVALAGISRLTFQIAAIAAAALALAIGVAAAVTRRLYRPIEQLDRYVSSKVSLPRERGTELEKVSRAFRQVYESAADLESRERRSRLFRRNELLLRVLTGAVLPWEESAAPQLADHGIAFFESPSALFSLLFLRVDRPEESLARYAGEEREAVLYGVLNVFCEVIGGSFPCEGCRAGEDSFLLAARCRPEDAESFLFDAQGLLEEAQEHVRRIFRFTVSAAVLAPESAPLGFSARYGTLLTLAGRLFVAGENAVLDSVDNEYVLLDERQKQNLLEALRAGSFERAAQAYRAISDEAARRSLENIMNVYLYLAYLLYNEYGASLELESGSFATVLLPFIGRVERQRTKEGVDEAFLALFSEILRSTDETARSRSGSLVEELKTSSRKTAPTKTSPSTASPRCSANPPLTSAASSRRRRTASSPSRSSLCGWRSSASCSTQRASP